jgi:flagellin-like hook-associated protein FlgL
MVTSLHNNLAAQQVRRQVNRTQQGLSRTLERLASGLRINRAGDDAAGLAVSEKMLETIELVRVQILQRAGIAAQAQANMHRRRRRICCRRRCWDC